MCSAIPLVGHTGIVDASPASGTVFRPIWNGPKHLEILDGGEMPFVDDAALDTGKLGLIWAGILILGGVLFAINGAPARATRKCPSCAENILAEANRCRFCGADVASGLSTA